MPTEQVKTTRRVKSREFRLPAMTLKKMVEEIELGLSGETDNKGCTSNFYPASDSDVIEVGGLGTQFKVYVTWRTKEVLLYVKSRKSYTNKSTTSSCVGKVASVTKNGRSYTIRFEHPAYLKGIQKENFVIKEAEE